MRLPFTRTFAHVPSVEARAALLALVVGAGLMAVKFVAYFLTGSADQAAYVSRAMRSLRPGGHLLLATFSVDGPEKCSGLPVCRYGADALAAKFAEGFTRIADRRELHHTPFGTDQSFTYLLLQRLPAASME